MNNKLTQPWKNLSLELHFHTTPSEHQRPSLHDTHKSQAPSGSALIPAASRVILCRFLADIQGHESLVLDLVSRTFGNAATNCVIYLFLPPKPDSFLNPHAVRVRDGNMA